MVAGPAAGPAAGRVLALWLAWAAVSAEADTAFVTCQPANALAVIDLSGGKGRTDWVVGGAPAGVAIGPGGSVFTVATEGKTVRRHDASTGTVLAEAVLDGGPIGIAVDFGRGRVIVTDWFNARAWVLDAVTLAPLAELATGAAPAGVALSDDGRYLATADKDSDQVSLFDAGSLQPLGAVAVGTRPFGLGFAPDGRLFVGNVGSNDVSVVDPVARRVIATAPVGERPYGVAFAQGRAFVTDQYASTVSVIDLASLSPVATIEVGEYPEGIDSAADGSAVIVVNWFDNSLMVIDAIDLKVIDTVETCDGPRAFGRFIAEGGQ